MAGRIQNEDLKSVAELTAGGGTAAQLPNDDKVYLTALALNKTLKQAIIDGDLSGGGSTQTFTATTISAATTLSTEQYVYAEAPASLTILTLPAAPSTGKWFVIKKEDNTLFGIRITGKIEQATYDVNIYLEQPGDMIRLQYTGTFWRVIKC